MLTPIFPGIVYIVLLAKMFPFEILDRYVPHVAELIFQHMDIDALVRLRFVNKQWKKTIDKILFGEKMAVARYLQAASEGQQDICRLFLKHCTNKNPIGESKESGSCSGRRWRRCSGGVNKYTPLHAAAKYGQLEVFKMIGEWVPDINPPSSLLGDQVRGLTPLHLAARYGHLLVCERIIDVLEEKHQHEEKRIIEFLDPPDVNGMTPLHCAAYGSHLDVCQLLLDHVGKKPAFYFERHLFCL